MQRRWKKTARFLLIVLIGLGGVLALLYLVAWFVLGSNLGHPPAILEGQKIKMVGRPVSDPEWTRTLHRRFPPGTNESDLIVILRGQKFWMDQRNHVAAYTWREPLCRVSVMVEWSSSPDHRITSIEGGSAGMCL